VYSSLVLALLIAPLATLSPHAESGAGWLSRLNHYRQTAMLPPVIEEPRLSGPVLQHARYMVMHDVLKHSQNRRHAWATREGAAAAAVSNLAASLSAGEPDWWAVDAWMQAPFHAVGILDPTLREVGFGIYSSANGKIQTAAGLDVISGRRTLPSPVSYPIVWPAPGSSVPFISHFGEYPSPLTSCAGYQAPSGLPLIVQIGSGGATPHVTGSWFAEGDRQLEHCVFDESTYVNRTAEAQRLGRSILASRDAIVLIPRRPLRPGATYRAVIEVDDKLVDWTFNIDLDM
jgi:hypothetical protein